MRHICLLFVASLCVVAHVDPAHAYLDPGTGSILLQGLLAVIAGAAVTLKLYWARVKDFFGRHKAEAGAQSKSDE